VKGQIGSKGGREREREALSHAMYIYASRGPLALGYVGGGA